MVKLEKSIIYSVTEPSKEVLWLHYKDGKLILESYENNGWEPIGANTAEIQAEIGNLEELTTENKSSLVNAINEVAERSSGGDGIVSITYAELKALRDNAQLVPGTQYRITDYHCTTIQENTTSADNQFDIIVTADSESVLNENARAIQHDIPSEPQLYLGIIVLGSDTPILVPATRYSEGDIEYDGTLYYAFIGTYAGATQVAFCKNLTPEEHDVLYMWDEEDEYMFPSDNDSFYFHYEVPTDYFADCNLAAWQLKYSLDNDTSRFAWALDYHENMRFTNEAYTYERYKEADSDGKFAWKEINTGEIIFTDAEVPVPGDTTYHVYAEEPYEAEVLEITQEPVDIEGFGVIYYMKDEWNNECPYDFKNIQFKRKLTDGEYDPDSGTDTWVYTFTWVNESDNVDDLSIIGQELPNDEGQYSGVFGNIIRPVSAYTKIYPEHPSKFGIALNDIVFISSYSYDEGPFYGCYSNTFGNECFYNTFGNECLYNTFGDLCDSNTFGNSCRSNTFGNSCDSNTFGDNCFNNTFSNDCSLNTFGNECGHNIFGDNCYSNTFGNSCHSNTFGNSCYYNTFGNGTAINYCKHIALGDGVQYCKIYGTTTPTSSKYLQNIKVAQGLRGTNSSKLAIEVPTGLVYDVYVGMNSSGVLKRWCPADNINTEIEEEI